MPSLLSLHERYVHHRHVDANGFRAVYYRT
ncbi:hypothetical protein BC793_13848 [Actinoplanes xinjiangensis]|uniref:Uncharacterized protein n=1 Tax=Actinoplanes xinjiangensis TaxID=512350 RepID=A0A316F2U2_9ACTN|nr:hypothetical protein BC793_13848 [Actinoplanes xinjiangensis]